MEDSTLLELIRHGVGYLHDNQSHSLQTLIRTGLCQGHLSVLACTPSMAWSTDLRGMSSISSSGMSSGSSESGDVGTKLGLILSVVVRSTCYWSEDQRRHLPYPTLLLTQMAGHAGVVHTSTNTHHQQSSSSTKGPTVTVLCHDQQRRTVSNALTGSTAGAYESTTSLLSAGSSGSSGSGGSGTSSSSSVLPSVESQIDTCLHDEMLSLVCTGAVESRQDALDYLTWTFMYKRLPRNPNYYGLASTNTSSASSTSTASAASAASTDSNDVLVSSHLSELIEETFEDLHNSGCVHVESEMDVVSSMNLGMIATYYQAEYTTLEIFAASLRPGLHVGEALEILTAASEFSSHLSLRSGEQRWMREEMKRLPLRMSGTGMNENGIYDTHAKANLLLQTWLNQHHTTSHTSITSSEKDTTLLPSVLREDRERVLRMSLHLCKALVDVAAQSCQEEKGSHHAAGSGSLRSTLVCCELNQLLCQGMLPQDSSLYQIPQFNTTIVERCLRETIREEEDETEINENTMVTDETTTTTEEETMVDSVLDVLDMEDEQRRSCLSSLGDSVNMNSIASFCNEYPSIDVQYTIKNKKKEDENVMVGDTLTITALLQRDEEEEEEEDNSR